MLSTLREISLFANISQDDLVKLSDIVQQRKFSKGNIIFLEDEPGQTFYIIKSGLVKISRIASDGRIKTLSILQPFDYFGEMAVLDSHHRSATAEALVDSVLLVIYKNDFENLIKKNPHIALEIIHTLSERLRYANQQIEDLAFQDSQRRLINIILKLTQQFGEKDAEKIKIKITLTHQELSELAGVSRETVTRHLNHLEREGLIKLEKHQLIILNEKDLKKYKSKT